MNGIDYARNNNYIPIVDMLNHKTLYNEDIEIFGTMNAWEYYFSQPDDFNVGMKTANHYSNNGEVKGEIGIKEIKNPLEINRIKKLIKNNIKTLPYINDVLLKNDFYNNRKTLGVHIRGTDMRSCRYKNHPIPQPPEIFLQKALLLDQENHYDYVYLACDECYSISLFQNAFKNKLIFQDIDRSENGDVLHASSLNFKNREFHRYKLGLEVLIDALLLSKTTHFIHSISNVSLAAILFATNEIKSFPIPPLAFS